MHARFTQSLLALAILAGVASPASAHGDFPPKHGGVMNEGGETTFELVTKGRQVEFHLGDHGRDLSTDGAKGVVTVKSSASELRSDLLAAGSNRLAGTLAAPLRPGDSVMARVTLGNGSVVVGRFTIVGPAARPPVRPAGRTDERRP